MSCNGSPNPSNPQYNRNAEVISKLAAGSNGKWTTKQLAGMFHDESSRELARLVAEFPSAHQGRKPNRDERKGLTQEAHATARQRLEQAMDRPRLAVSPADVAAVSARLAKRRETAATAPRLAYSTTTGDPAYQVPALTETRGGYEPEAHCFVCHRHTDHFGEHEGLVEAGLAEYDSVTGSVYRTPAWDDARAREVKEREYAAYKQQLEADAAVAERSRRRAAMDTLTKISVEAGLDI